MNPELLLAHFDRFGDVANAIPRLRRLIFALAVRGKLVKQDSNDEPAAALLGGDRRRLLDSETEPWKLPAGWAWSSLDLIGETLGGGTPSKADPDFWNGSIPWVSPKDMKVDVLTDAHDHISTSAVEHSATRLIPTGSLVMVVRGMILAHSFPTALTAVPLTINQDMKAIVPFRADLIRFLLLLTKGLKPEVLRLVRRSTHGTCKLLTADLFSLPISIPPLAEQCRIVAKVDELMVLCDRLEAAQTERQSRRERLAAAALHRLNKSGNAEDFHDNARFYLTHLPLLTIHREEIGGLRQAILNLAVRGQLVLQDPNDESVVDLLTRNDQLRRAIAREDRRADAQKQVLLAAESRWSIPPSWIWGGLADLVLFIDYRGKTPSKTEKGVRLITAKNVKRSFINISPEEFLSESVYKAWMTRGLPMNGDILFTTEAPMGNVAVVRLVERFALAQRVICFRPYGAVNPDFLTLQLLSEPFQSILNRTATGLTAKGIKAAKLKRLPVAVPPLAEQRRIVAKVDELMALCDRLEQHLRNAETESHHLLGAVFHQALNDDQEPNDLRKASNG